MADKKGKSLMGPKLNFLLSFKKIVSSSNFFPWENLILIFSNFSGLPTQWISTHTHQQPIQTRCPTQVDLQEIFPLWVSRMSETAGQKRLQRHPAETQLLAMREIVRENVAFEGPSEVTWRLQTFHLPRKRLRKTVYPLRWVDPPHSNAYGRKAVSVYVLLQSVFPQRSFE